MNTTRRKFLTLLGGTATAAVLKPLIPVAEPNIVFSLPEKTEFFDVVTYTGDTGASMIQYNLGWAAESLIIKKRVGDGPMNWLVKNMKKPWEEAKAQNFYTIGDNDPEFKEYEVSKEADVTRTVILRPVNRSLK